jgi:xanthosine utilization system XapX-like protein
MHGMFVFVLGLALTSGALAVLQATAPAPPRLLELSVLIGATAGSTVVRFVLFRSWIFRPARSSGRVSLWVSAWRAATRASA